MKKVMYCLVVVVLLTGLISGCAQPAATPAPGQTPTPTPTPASTPASAPEPIKLICASWEGPEGSSIEAFAKWMAPELEERSGGRVKVEIAYGAVMGATPEHYDLAVTGVADIAHVGLPFSPGRFPMAEVVELPLASTPAATEYVYGRAYWELYKRGWFDEDFKDVKVLFLAHVGPYDFQMANKRVLSLDDIQGLKIRASGKTHTQIIETLGAVPVGMPGNEVYTAMEKGVIDGNFSCWSFIYAFRTEPITKYVTTVGLGGFGHGYFMNQDTYNNLPADIKALIDELSDKWNILAGHWFNMQGEQAQYELFKAAGGEIDTLSEAELQKIWDAMAPIWDNWIAEGEAKGLPRKQMVDDFYNILKEMRVDKPFYGYEP
jgi:TRAP-type C4-dicarboxylate transport system substrate-binding protein